MSELGSGKKIILHFPDRQIGIEHPEIKHRVDLHRNVIAGDHILRRDIHGHRAQIHLDHLFDARNDVNHARSARPDHAAKAKHDAPLILFENLDAADERRYRNDREMSQSVPQVQTLSDLLLLSCQIQLSAARLTLSVIPS